MLVLKQISYVRFIVVASYSLAKLQNRSTIGEQQKLIPGLNFHNIHPDRHHLPHHLSYLLYQPLD